MLVLTRKAEEKIVIGDENPVVITVLKIERDKVSIGVAAPAEVKIYREELLNKSPQKHKEAVELVSVSEN